MSKAVVIPGDLIFDACPKCVLKNSIAIPLRSRDGRPGVVMTLQVQKIVMPEVRRSAVSPLTWEETLVGQVFAFDANQIRDEAKKQEGTNHDLLLWPTIRGLWDTYPGQRVLAGYVPG